ncbi:acyl-CoA thioesterase [Actinoplanes xinjiangensis]|uniref:Acyl-CoA thioester hydrolase n=1 Tax=Actinoplanes xinjiangensis TaxID=512350 RepID=A0A316FBI0_9ACTN|nr:thioesterase family protein [Actinoplanes xinjiangensis]PWK46241.1 acyl-CoA thioester hydrolase [Actinoplanes xinjiangensis]GIF40823.1 thioesterase [Actinoplanes xinjiangensis]
MTERFVYDVPVRWSDMDAYGHVNNARFLTLYEEARVAMFFVGARAHGLGSFEEGIVIARHEIDYLRPIDFGDPVRIEMWVSQLRVASFTVSYEMFDDGVLASRAKSVCVPYNLAQGHPRRLSDAERAFLKPYTEVSAMNVDRS